MWQGVLAFVTCIPLHLATGSFWFYWFILHGCSTLACTSCDSRLNSCDSLSLVRSPGLVRWLHVLFDLRISVWNAVIVQCDVIDRWSKWEFAWRKSSFRLVLILAITFLLYCNVWKNVCLKLLHLKYSNYYPTGVAYTRVENMHMFSPQNMWAFL